MITYEEAYNIALSRIISNCEIAKDLILEKPYGWYFREQTKEYSQTRDIRHILRGGESFIVEREDGRIVSFNSAFGLENNLRYYEEGFKHKIYDLVNEKNYDFEATVQFLIVLQLIHHDFRLIEKKLIHVLTSQGSKEMDEILSSLPYTFSKKRLYFAYPHLLEMKYSNWFDYRLIGYDESE